MGKDKKLSREDATERLMDALKRKDVKEVRQAIADGADVRRKGGYDSGRFISMIFDAISYGPPSVDCLKALLDAGAEVDWRAMTSCASGGHEEFPERTECLRVLIDAAPHLVDAENPVFPAQTPLALALDWGNVEAVKMLCEAGADPNLLRDGQRPLCEPPTRHQAALITMLFDFGADPRLEAKNDHSSLLPIFQFYLGSNHDGFFDEFIEIIRPLFESWTPHRKLSTWKPDAFPLYIDHCPGFRDAVLTLLLCLLRFRHFVPRGVALEIVAKAAEGHRKEMWWPIVGFSMAPYM